MLHRLYVPATRLYQSSKMHETQSSMSILAATSGILLANPAHQSAWNARKCLMISGALSFQRELDFSSALLRGSRDCSKQSIVWAHRQWIFRHVYQPYLVQPGSSESHAPEWTRDSDSAHFPEVPSAILRSEFDLIARCCELYARNYHAWSHWHFCMESLYFAIHSAPDAAQADLDAFANEFVRLREWVDRHVSDHSAIHQLCSLARRFYGLAQDYSSRLNTPSGNVAEMISPISMFEHAMGLTCSYPSHESLWIYLRQASFMAYCSGAGASPDANDRLVRMVSSNLSDCHLRRQFFAWLERQAWPSLFI